MYFSIGEHVVETNWWQREQDLLDALDSCEAGKILLGSDSGNHPMNYSAIIHLDYAVQKQISFIETKSVKFGVGIQSNVPGTVPTLLWIPPTEILIGYNCEVASVGLDRGSVRYRKSFDTPFSAFFLCERSNQLLIFSEIGVISLLRDGTEIWRYESDIVTDRLISSETIKLMFMDREPVEIDLDSGSLI